MGRTTLSQSNHDWMIEQMVETYVNLGHSNIRADHVQHYNGAPALLGEHTPDITAVAGPLQIPIICEVETADSMEEERTRLQLTTFRQAANSVGGVLHVGLPFKSDLEKAKRIAATWGILVDQWWYGVAL